MLTFDEARAIAADHYGEPFARDGVQDDGVCLVTPQSVGENEARGIIVVGGAWIAVDRLTGVIAEWPHLEYIERVVRMREANASRSVPRGNVGPEL